MKVNNQKIKFIFKEWFFFDVYVNNGDKSHKELYSMHRDAYNNAVKLGIFTRAFFDFKPVKMKERSGGVYKVDRTQVKGDRVYYYSGENVFSLPKYLDKLLPRKDYILFMRREPLDYKYRDKDEKRVVKLEKKE